MSCRLKENRVQEIIPITDLPVGKIGVIVEDTTGHNGWIVTKNNEDGGFDVLGTKNYFGKTCSHKVRILEPGELIEVRYS